jgi:hypothetical protein
MRSRFATSEYVGILVGAPHVKAELRNANASTTRDDRCYLRKRQTGQRLGVGLVRFRQGSLGDGLEGRAEAWAL